MPSKQSHAGISFDKRDMLSGLLMVAMAAGFAWLVLKPQGLALGSARAMGPGYFPLMVTIILAALGLIMIVLSFGRETESMELVPLRSIALVMLGPILFALLVRPLGFVAAVGAMVMISAWSSQRMTWKWAIYTTLGMIVFSVLLFYYMLAMPISLWGDGSILPFQ
jgi:hypothetical protein